MGDKRADPVPAIVIVWSDQDQAWLATAVSSLDPIVGSSTGDGRTPADALQTLLEKRLLLSDDAFVPTKVRIVPICGPDN